MNLLKPSPPQQLPYDRQAVEHFTTVLKSKLKRNNQYVSRFKIEDPIAKKKELPPIPKMEKNESAPSAEVIQRPVKVTWQPEVAAVELPSLPKVPKIDSNTKQVLDQIESFENKISNSNYEEELAGIGEDSTLLVDFIKSRAHMDPSMHLKELTKLVDSGLIDKKQSQLYLEKIRLNRQEAESSKKERERRRKKVLLLHQQIQKEIEKKALAQMIESKLLRQSKQERRIAEQLMQVRHEKEVMRENRIYREEQFTKSRQIEYEQALEREHQLCLTLKQEYEQQVEMQMRQHFEILEQKKRMKHDKNVRFCHHLVDQVVDLCFKTIDYKRLNDGKNVPVKKLREWKLLFQNDLPLNEVHFPLDQDFIPPSSDEPILEDEPLKYSEEIPYEIRVLDTQELQDYISFQGSWACGDSALVKNEGLSNLIEDLFQITLPPIEPYPVTIIPAVPLRIALTGKKYSGKSTLAKVLADKYQMTVLRIDDLVKEAIANADISVKKGKDKNSSEKDKKPLSKQQIGAKLQLPMMEGQAPDDFLLVSLVLEAMSQEPERPGGYLLVDFPKTRQQAQLLEREISGYEDPKPIKKGDLKRAKDKERATTGNRNRSLINPAENPQDNPVPQPISGLDAVFLLDVKNEVAFKRASGQLIDPISNQKYHLENDPPPTDAPGTYDRLAPVEDSSRSMAQLQYHLSAFSEEEESLKEWLNQFKTLHIIDANNSKDVTQKQVLEELNEVVSAINKNHQKDLDESQDSKERIDSADADQMAERLSRIGERPSIAKPLDTLELIEIPESIKENEKKKRPSSEFAKVLIDQWKVIETTYTDQLKFAFRSQRRTSHEILNYFYGVRTRFCDYLRRPDMEQNLLEAFQTEYNLIEEDFRSDPDVKAELHQRAEELREKLWEVADRRRDEAEAERIAIIEDKWVEDQSYVIANIVVTILQAEADRYFATRQLILDYVKDSEGVLFVDIPKNQLKIPFIQNSTQAPIEVAQPLIALSEQQTLQRKDQVQSASQQKTTTTKEKGKEAKEKKEKQKQSDQSKANAQAPVVEKDYSQYLDPESTYFPDIQNAIDSFMNALQSPEYSIEPILALERNKEHSNWVQLFEVEDALMKQRIEKIKLTALEWAKNLRNNSIQVYSEMDEWIGTRYRVEVEVARDVMNVVKEAIEAEQKLSNLITIDGDRLFLDFGTLVVPPKEDPPPEIPVEKPAPDQFTVAQLRGLGKQLRAIHPNGFIPTKQMIEFLIKTAGLYASLEPLPEGYLQADVQLIQQTIQVLDPFETGFVSWKKFVILNARLLPVEIETIIEMKERFSSFSSFPFLSKEDYMSTRLWFEPPIGTIRRGFDRPGKLKEALFGILF
jgi:adenylate kinase family enzyme